jgi:hypothetical protein
MLEAFTYISCLFVEDKLVQAEALYVVIGTSPSKESFQIFSGKIFQN